MERRRGKVNRLMEKYELPSEIREFRSFVDREWPAITCDDICSWSASLRSEIIDKTLAETRLAQRGRLWRHRYCGYPGSAHRELQTVRLVKSGWNVPRQEYMQINSVQMEIGKRDHWKNDGKL